VTVLIGAGIQDSDWGFFTVHLQTQLDIPNPEAEDGVPPEREISKKQKLNLRKADAESQVTFWKLNLTVRMLRFVVTEFSVRQV
jgi:hypothetical protein